MRDDNGEAGGIKRRDELRIDESAPTPGTHVGSYPSGPDRLPSGWTDLAQDSAGFCAGCARPRRGFAEDRPHAETGEDQRFASVWIEAARRTGTNGKARTSLQSPHQGQILDAAASDE